MMDKYIERFTDQLSDALRIGDLITLNKIDADLIIICGMGGSGIGGALIKEIFKEELAVPVLINKSYDFPSFAGPDSLVILSSYSGNTEEIIEAGKQAVMQQCRVICITTGGKLERIAGENGFTVIKIADGMPPRAGLGYSLIAQMFILHAAGLISNTFIPLVESAVNLLIKEQAAIRQKASILAEKIYSTMPVIYITVEMEAVALRWKQQLNENAKTLCLINVIPEMNHNELEGYSGNNKNVSVIFLRNSADHKRIKNRFELCRDLISNKVNYLEEIFSIGDNYIERMFYLIHLGDWLSYYVSKLKNVDADKIELLDNLKYSMNKF